MWCEKKEKSIKFHLNICMDIIAISNCNFAVYCIYIVSRQIKKTSKIVKRVYFAEALKHWVDCEWMSCSRRSCGSACNIIVYGHPSAILRKESYASLLW